MATRAATFTAKIRTLYDYHLRTVHNILPLPSGIDIANTLKYFSQTLLGVLRDVPTLSMEMMKSRDCDHARVSLFPNLDYKGLYYAVVQLVDIVPMIQYGTAALGYAILFSLACLVPFLEHEYMDTLPCLVASSMAMFPTSLHKDIIEMLCNHLLPFTVTQTEPDNHNYASLSTASIIMLVFQYTENTAFHCQLLECLMSWKADVLRDLLCVIAHGTPNSRAPAANLLFYYWPSLNPALHDRRGIHLKVSGWKPLTCQRDNCLSPVNNGVVKMLLDHSIAIGCGDHPPPMYICQDCAEQIKREQPSANIRDVLLPLQQISMTCENKSCRSSDKTAVSTCFSIDCASYNGNHPIRYCSQCHGIRHNNRRGGDHVFHSTVASPWSMDPETQGFMVEAIVSLLMEAQPPPDRRLKECDDRHPRVALLLDSELNPMEAGQLEEGRLLSRYGIYLLVGLCTPNEDTPVETLGRLLGMLFQWFDALAYLPDDQAGNTLERLKSEYIHGWLMDVCRTHFEVFVSCLLPHPVEYARVGGHWDTLANRTSHIKEGFNRLFCLVPYEIISLEVWDYIMPYWLEAIRNEVPEEEMSELRVLLSKVLDPEMSPLGFDAHQMYRFISIRFHNTTPPVQEQALFWLQVLSMLNVVIPLSLLFTMFNDGVKSSSSPPTGPPAEGAKVLHASKDELTTNSGMGAATTTDDSRANSPFSSGGHPASHVVDTKTDSEVNLTCFILMLDILLKQLELQEVDPHQGMEHIVSRESLALIEDMVRCPWVGTHTCKDNTTHDCVGCELATTFYQLSLDVIAYISPVMEIRKVEVPDETEVVGGDESSRRGSPSDEQFPLPSIQTAELPMFSRELDDGQGFGVQQVFTAAVQTVLDTDLDTVAIMPTEEVVRAVARAVTLTETDVGLAKVSVALPTIVDENDQQQPNAKDASEEDGTFWHTTQGKFKFTIEELPPQLQLLYSLLKNLSKYENSDVLYHVLCCIKLLCLHAECLNRAAKENRGFLIWCQENLLISNLWKLVQAEHSHISQVCVEILEHCVTLPSGADVFWKIIEENFHNKDWTVRSSAVEKVTMISRFVEWEPVKQSLSLQSSLANAFCYLISSMDDINPTVAQKAVLCLETIKDSSLKCLCWCLEVQFDTVIMDRPMILQTLYQLYNRLSDRKILSWEFFLNRFDALFLEAQVSLERSGEIAYPRVDKEKLFSRRSSAPVLKRKCSKFGIAQVVGQLPNHLFPDGNLKEPQQEENSFLNMLHRVMELNDSDKDTLHLLVFLFMQFLSRADHAYPSDEKAIAKVQNIVLRHLNVLLGYNPQDRGFCIPPHRLRSSPVFNAFIFSLPCVLDHNFRMGTLLLTTCLPLLQYCPSPQRNASEIQYPNYSLWYLEPYARHSWLMSVLTFVYKYRYSSLPLSRQVQGLIRIVLTTLDAQDHKCHHLPDGCLLTTPNTSRSRDLSNLPTGDLQHGPERDTPPHGPGLAMDSSRVTVSYQAEAKVVYQKTDTQEETESVTFDDIYTTEPPKAADRSDWGQPWKPRKLPDYSFSEDVDDTEPELEAIPESPKSENSVPDSLQGSLGELATFQEASSEKARIRVETGISPGEEGVLVVNPPLEQALKAVTSPLAAGPVESQMAHQIEAFHESFDRGRRVDVGELKVATVTVVQAEPFSPRVCQSEHVGSAELPSNGSMTRQEKVLSPKGVAHLSPITTSNGNNLHVITKRPPLKSARSFSYETKAMRAEVRDKSKLGNSGSDVTGSVKAGSLCPSDASIEQFPPLIEAKPKAKLQRSRTLDSTSLPAAAGKPEPSKKLEVLDARQLEQSIRRREPAVISQCEQQLPQQTPPQSQYVFQPIQSHPITGRPETNDKLRPEYKSSHPIKVEPRRSPSIEGKEPPASPIPTFSPTLPWTIEVHSAIKLEPLPPVSIPERIIAASQTVKSPEKVEPTSSRKRLNRLGSLARTDSLTVDMGDSHEFHRTSTDPLPKPSTGTDDTREAPHGVTSSEFQFDLPSPKRVMPVGSGSRDTEIIGQTVGSFHQWTPKLDNKTEDHAGSLREIKITTAQSDVVPSTDNFSKCDSLIPVSLQLLPTVGKSGQIQGSASGILDTLRVEKVPVVPSQVQMQAVVVHGDSSAASGSLQRVTCGSTVAVRQYNLGGRSPYPGRSLTRVTSIPEEMTMPHEVYVPSLAGISSASHLTVAELTVEDESQRQPSTKLVVGEATSIQTSNKGYAQTTKSHLQPTGNSSHLQKRSLASCIGDQPRFMQRSMSVDIPDTHLLPPVEEEPKSTNNRNQRIEGGAPLSPLPPPAKSPAKGFSSFHSLSDPGGPHAFHRVDASAPASHRQLGGFITADHRPPPAKPDSSCSSQMLMQEARPTPGWATEARVIEPKTVHLDEIRPASSVVQVHQARVVTSDETVVEEQFLDSIDQDDLRQPSPKRLVKQSHITDTDLQHQSSGSTEAPSMEGQDEEGGSGITEPQPLMEHEDQKGRPHFRQKRQRKIGISSADLQKIIDQRNNVNRKSRKGESISQPPPKSTVVPPSALRCGEDAVVERCPECGAVLEQYTDEELALCVVILATFVHREPALAAPTLPEILRTVARIASMTMYAWQHETNIYLPGGASSVAKQFLRCVLHQLAPNGIFLQIFQSNIDDGSFFKTVASALTDFNELNPVAPLQLLLEGLNDSEVLPLENIPQIMENIANYMGCLPLETASSAWTNILPQFDSFFRKLYLILPGQPLDVVPTFKIMASILKIPGLNSFRSILDPFSKMLSFAIQNWNLVYQTLVDVCHLCNRAFTKERDKLVLSRTVVFELVQALKFRSSISDDNLLMLVQFVVQDAGGTLGPSMIVEDLVPPIMDVQNMINTNACECMRQHLNDALDFVADVHTLSRVKSNFKGTLMGLNEDTLGATLKAGIAQYLALEITRGNSRDNRTIGRYLPWLYNPPTAVQQGPKEFLDCVAHMRLLSWLLLGALTHTAMLGTNSNLVCQPIPLEASCHVADHIQIILTGFAEQSKASVLHMSSLFHAFILCQLWTMYCEQMASLDPPGSEHHNSASITLTDFWAKITPGILQLLSHSKVLAEMVNLHFLSLMEALLECNSTVLAKLFPMWSPVLNADLCQLPGHLQVRLQACEDRMPPKQTKDELTNNTSTLLKWLQRLQFKMGQIELQSSAATQFYSV